MRSWLVAVGVLRSAGGDQLIATGSAVSGVCHCWCRREVCHVVVDRYSLSASAGVLQLSVLRGRPFSAAATAARSSAS